MEIVKIDLVPSGVMPSCHASQYDIGREIRFLLTDGGEEYTLAGTETISIELRKPDGTSETIAIENTSSNYVDWETSDGELDLSGVYLAEISIKNGDDVLGSANFIVKTEADAYDGADVRTVTIGPADICTFETTLAEPLQSVIVDVEASQDLHGYDHPWPAGGGKNKFDYSQAINTAFSNNNGVFTNAIADTRENFSFQIQAFNADTLVAQTLPMAITSTGKHSQTITIDQPITRLTIKHNGLQQDIRIYYPFTKLGTFTISIDVLGYNPTVVGGLSFKNVQIESGSEATPYEPYENVCPINGYSSANITRCGVNLWYSPLFTKWTNTGTYMKLSKFTPEGVSLTMSFKDKDTTVDVSGCYFGFVDSDYATGSLTDYRWILNNGTVQSTKTNKSINSDKLCCSLLMYPNNETTYNKILARYDIQIELGSTATPYHAYNGQTYTIAFGQTVYGGVPDVTRGKLHVTWGYADFDGSEDERWRKIVTSNPNTFGLRLPNFKYLSGITSTDDILNNYLTVILPTETFGNFHNFLSVSNDSTLIIEITSITTESDLRTYLSGNPLTVVYELDTPFDIDLTPEVISAVVGTNNVFADCGSSTVKYLKAGV